MNKIILIACILILPYTGLGQTDINDKIESRKIALITQKLDLTPDQAEKFWPIYKQFSAERRGLIQDFSTKRRAFDANSASDEEMKEMIDMGLKVKERQLGLERDYSERMRAVISDRQLLNLRRAEEDFKQMLLKRVRERRQQAEQNRQRNDAIREKRRNN